MYRKILGLMMFCVASTYAADKAREMQEAIPYVRPCPDAILREVMKSVGFKVLRKLQSDGFDIKQQNDERSKDFSDDWYKSS